MAFETSTDTVSSEHPEQIGAPQDSTPEPLLRYGVQIGAYKDPQNATRAQVLARERFQIPVMNDFHADSALYHVRIGSFAVKDSAYSFRSMMQRQYPQDYRDSWIVRFLKQP